MLSTNEVVKTNLVSTNEKKTCPQPEPVINRAEMVQDDFVQEDELMQDTINDQNTDGNVVNKENLSRESKANPTPSLITKYKKYRNIYSKCLRTAQKLFTRRQISEANGDSRKIWSVLKDSLRLPRKSNQINKIIIGDETISDNVKIANSFNSYFSNIGPSISESIPSTNSHFSDFLPPP